MPNFDEAVSSSVAAYDAAPTAAAPEPEPAPAAPAPPPPAAQAPQAPQPAQPTASAPPVSQEPAQEPPAEGEPPAAAEPAAVPTQDQPPPQPVSIDEQEVEITLYGQKRMAKVADLKRVVQKAEAMELKLEEASRAKDEADGRIQSTRNVLERITADPFSAVVEALMVNRGINREMAENEAERVFRDQTRTLLELDELESRAPGARAARRQARDVEEREQALRAKEQAALEADRRRDMAVAAAKRAVQVDTALKGAGVKADITTRALFSEAVRAAGERGLSLTAQQAAVIVKSQLPRILGELADGIPLEDLHQRAPRLVEAVRKSDLAAVKKARLEPSTTKPAETRQPARREPDKPIGSVKNFRQFIDAQLGR